jgi:hypothetical protein
MGILKKAVVGTHKIMLDETDYIEVKTDLPIGAVEDLMVALPDIKEGEDPTTAQNLQSSHALFEALVVGWSLPDPATVEEYRLLDADAAIITQKLLEHFQTLSLNKSDQKSPRTSVEHGHGAQHAGDAQRGP